MRHIVLIFCLAITPSAFGQDTFHVFPQIADGVQSDGTSYKSTFMIVPFIESDSPLCTLRIYGLAPTLTNGASGTIFNVAVPRNSFFYERTSGTQPLQTGYATLTCDKPVEAQVLYTFQAADGSKLGEATVFSSTESFKFRMIYYTRDQSNFGIAIANNTDQNHTYDIKMNGTTLRIGVNARSSKSMFVPPNVVAGAPTGLGLLTVNSTDFSEFSMIGFKYTGQIFTTIPANW